MRSSALRIRAWISLFVSEQIRIIEMGPRNGLENERDAVSVDSRIAFVGRLVDAGLHTVEISAFA